MSVVDGQYISSSSGIKSRWLIWRKRGRSDWQKPGRRMRYDCVLLCTVYYVWCYPCRYTSISFYVWQLYQQVLLRARVLAMGILSVRPSVSPRVMTRYRIKPRWDRDSRFSPYDILESLVSYEVNLVPLGEEIPLERGHQRGVPRPLEIVILPLLAHLAWKRLQIDTDLLLIITNTADELCGGTNIVDLERPWTPKIGVFSEFSAISGCSTHFNSELRRNHSR